MQTATDDLFKSVADPTRRALFERLSRDGEQTVRMLTDNWGVSQLVPWRCYPVPASSLRAASPLNLVLLLRPCGLVFGGHC
jgi:hypothetical protein